MQLVTIKCLKKNMQKAYHAACFFTISNLKKICLGYEGPRETTIFKFWSIKEWFPQCFASYEFILRFLFIKDNDLIAFDIFKLYVDSIGDQVTYYT